MSDLRNDQMQQTSSQSTEEKKPYQAPTLSKLGNVRAITQTEGTVGSQPTA